MSAQQQLTTHLDIDLFREEKGGNPELIRESQRRRFKRVEVVDEVIAIDKQWREADFQLSELRKELNQVSKANGLLRREGKPLDEALVARSKQISESEIPATERRAEELRTARDKLMNSIGNPVHETATVSNNEEENAIERTWGQDMIPARQAKAKFSHVDLVLLVDGVDLERGVQVAGGRGYFLKNELVLLNQALINFGLATLMASKYVPLQTPFFMRQSVMQHCAQLEQFDEELYHVSGDGEPKYLIATSEQPISAMHMGEAFVENDLPIRYCGISTNFRKEVGSHGRDTLGIFRIHQFEKVEQFVICSPRDNKSWAMFEEMIGNSERFYQALGIPYRVVNICTGALNNAAAKKFDLEGFFPGGKTPCYRELVSCSNCTDYQSRKLRIRYSNVSAGKKTEYVHMLNSTMCATERLMCCILENYQTEDGIEVPQVLRSYMGGIEKIPFRVDPATLGKRRSQVEASAASS